jgi:hypothetical protein
MAYSVWEEVRQNSNRGLAEQDLTGQIKKHLARLTERTRLRLSLKILEPRNKRVE